MIVSKNEMLVLDMNQKNQENESLIAEVRQLSSNFVEGPTLEDQFVPEQFSDQIFSATGQQFAAEGNFSLQSDRPLFADTNFDMDTELVNLFNFRCLRRIGVFAPTT